MKGNRQFIFFQFSFFASIFIIAGRSLCLNHQTWRTICHFPLNDSWEIYLYCCRVSGSNICRSAEDNLSLDIFDRLSMRASWSQSWPFGVVGRGEQRVSCALAPVTCWCANSCRGRRGENYLLNLGVYEDAEASRLPNGAVHVCHLAIGTGLFQGDPVQWALRGKGPFIESCANQEELSAVRNAAHLLQSSVEAH